MTLRMAKAKLALHMRRQPERQLQIAVAQYLRLALIPPAFFTTFPSGGGGKARGGQLKSMGLLAGMPDLLVFWGEEVDGYPMADLLGIELKYGKGSLRREQKVVAGLFSDIGSAVAVCRSINDVQAALAFWGVPHRAKVGGAK